MPLFRRACVVAIVSLLGSSSLAYAEPTVPAAPRAHAKPEAPAAPQAPDTDHHSRSLSDDDGDGTFTGEASTSGDVNIVGVTWPAADGTFEGSNEHGDGAEDAGEDRGNHDEASGEDDHGHGTARLRSRAVGASEWGEWSEMVVSHTKASSGTEGDLVMGSAEVEVEVVAGTEADEVTLTMWDSEEIAADSAPEIDLRVDGSALERKSELSATTQALKTVSPAGPIIATRSQWGADESVRKWSPNYIKGSEGVTIHHTAGSNAYTREQVPAILRSIYSYHAVTRDWGDVGYNLFVDKYGRAWEGRRGGPETSLRTAHALGMNRTTAGIAMIGDYETTDVPQAAFDGLAQLTSWKLVNHGVSRSGSFTHRNDDQDWTRTLRTIHGHRDVNDTMCPGQKFYDRMPEFRTAVTKFDRQLRATQRVAGADRYETAAQLAMDSHPFETQTLYLARGDALIEALTVGAGAAHGRDALLLTRKDDIPTSTQQALRDLAPSRVQIVGDTDDISEAAVAEVESLTDAEVTRIDVDNPYSLASNLAEQWDTSDIVYVTSGQEPVDALSGGAAAAHHDAPLLLARTNDLPQATADELRRLKPREVVILGGDARISAATAQSIGRAVPQAKVRRLAGSNRFATSAKIVQDTFEDSDRALVANGWAAIDAIAGTQYAAKSDSPVVLARRDCRPSVIADAMDDIDTHLHVLLGGTARLRDSSATSICD